MVRRLVPFSGVALAASLAGSEVSAAEARQPDQHFSIDPVADIVLSAGGAGGAGLTELILSTGEIVPQLPSSQGANALLSIDRVAVTQTIDPHAAGYSDIGLGLAVGFAALDPILSGFRDGPDAALVDAVIYAESLSLTLAFTDITKIAVRRPRPIDYKNMSTSDTNMELSFFSGHASICSATTATATYLAFIRSPHSPRPWITLAAGTLLTAFVSVERVRSGQHFPTDVVAGTLVGAAIGVLVPHLHRHKDEAPSLWIGVAPSQGGALVDGQGVL
jgi:membrane-associated phospholipid phosphatase